MGARGLCGRKGHAFTLYEYLPKRPHLAQGLLTVLEESGSAVPNELRQIAQQVASGWRQAQWTHTPNPPKKKKNNQGQQEGKQWEDWGNKKDWSSNNSGGGQGGGKGGGKGGCGGFGGFNFFDFFNQGW